MNTSTRRLVRASVFLLAMVVAIAAVGVRQAEAAKPYEGTTVKVIVNAEYVKYALTLVEKELFDKHGIKLEVEVIPGEAHVTKTLLEFNSGRSPWDLIMFNPTFIADYHRHFEPLEPFVKKLNLDLALDDIAKEYQSSNMSWGGTLYAMPLDGDIHIMFYNKVAFGRKISRNSRKNTATNWRPPDLEAVGRSGGFF